MWSCTNTPPQTEQRPSPPICWACSSLGNAFVSMSAVISLVRQYMSVNHPILMVFFMCRFFRSKYLAHLWNLVLVAMAMAALLSPYKIVAFFGSYPISLNKFRSHITSFLTCAIDVSSASVVHNDCMVSFLEHHVMAPPFKMKTLPLVDDRS